MNEKNKDKKTNKNNKKKPIIVILIIIAIIIAFYLTINYILDSIIEPSPQRKDYILASQLRSFVQAYITESEDVRLRNVLNNNVSFDALIEAFKHEINFEDPYIKGKMKTCGPYIENNKEYNAIWNPSKGGQHIGFEVLIDDGSNYVEVRPIKAIKDNYTEEETQGRAHRINLNWKSKKKENDPTDTPIETKETDATNKQITPKATESIHETIKVKEGLIVPQKYIDFLKNNNLVDQSDDIIFFEESDLNLDGETEVVIGAGYYSEESYSSYSKVYILKEKNNEIEMVSDNISNSGYSVCDVKLINLQNMPPKYIYFQLTNTVHLEGFKIIELSGTETEVICYSASATGAGNDVLEDFNNDGQYDGYTRNRWSYDVSYFSTIEIYKFINGKFVFDSSSVDLPDYPETPTKLIHQYVSLKHTYVEADEVYERMSEICKNEEVRNIDFSYNEWWSLTHELTYNDENPDLKPDQTDVKQSVVIDDGNNEIEFTFTMEKEENKWRIKSIDKRIKEDTKNAKSEKLIVYPVISVGSSEIIGGSINGKWEDKETIASKLNDIDYSIYNYDGKIGEASAVITEGTYIKQQLPYDINPINNFLGLRPGYNPLPRKAYKQINNIEIYKDIVNTFMKNSGLNSLTASNLNVIRVDIEGDGSEEVIITCHEWKNDEVFSLVLLRKIVGDDVLNIPIIKEFEKRTEEMSGPSSVMIFEINSLLDLNADGKLELILDGSGHDYKGIIVFELRENEVFEVIDYSTRRFWYIEDY